MILRIGSRGSPLARRQAEWVAGELKKKASHLDISFRFITTRADKSGGTPIQQIGGKGVFVKEIEEALLRQQIDLGVHSLKDLPRQLPKGLMLGPCPQREDPRDCLISRSGQRLEQLPVGARIGTSSPRRQAMIKHLYGERFVVEPFRGNIDTRLKKLESGSVDAIIVALAGLKRMGLGIKATQIFETDEFVPAPGQGCLGLEIRNSDEAVASLLQLIRDDESDRTARAERAFLLKLGGDCFVPVGATARIQKDQLEMHGLILDQTGEKVVKAAESGSKEDPESVGTRLAERLLTEGGAEIIARCSRP
ncbi:MAG: hydroxymethylbilane synthase [Elusimicrobia bacterium]|nr:hydroxymethylbilane synthase [Candidatus Obscuribacterium magneticum]